MNWIFATRNEHKVREVQDMLPAGFHIVSLTDVGFDGDLEETALTLDGNARQKAQYIYHLYGKACFSDDTGLEIDALNGAPGVLSARYAGEGKNSEDNIRKVLRKMEGVERRTARFRTVISLVMSDGTSLDFQGAVNGHILTKPRGSDGFGYDPIFVPEGETRSFAEMGLQEKSKLSHRGIAIQRLIEFIAELA